MRTLKELRLNLLCKIGWTFGAESRPNFQHQGGQNGCPYLNHQLNTAMNALFLARLGRVQIAARTARSRSAGLESKEDRLPRSIACIQPAYGLDLAATL